MYKAFICYGLPEAILSDKGPRFKPRSHAGEARYQWYAQQLGITPLYCRKSGAKIRFCRPGAEVYISE